ncbi:hypothetical protein BKA70DRAFT_1566967 [Coprinopsis sp. MPI-PUGE-AT-0042]|nr:hypothetical protein BKA70DRAFT_1566967 [Coprinopsis sp. MPI-PUGE-AT-0042]
MRPFSCPSAKPASPHSLQESSSSRGFPSIALFASAPGHDTFPYPPPLYRAAHGSEGTYLSFSLFAFAPVLGIESFRIYVSDILHPDVQRGVEEPLWLICVFANGSPRVENAGDAPGRVGAHPNGTVAHRYTEYLQIPDPYLVGNTPCPIRSSRLLGLDSKRPQTQQTRIIEATLLATPFTILHPFPQTILTTMRGAHGKIEGRAGLFKLDEDMRVVGMAQTSIQKSWVARRKARVMRHVPKPPPRRGKLAHSISAPGLLPPPNQSMDDFADKDAAEASWTVISVP